MNLSISGHHVEVTPALREYVTTKLRRIRHHFDQVIDVNVILSVEKLVQRAEMKLLVAGREIFAEATHTDLYAAVDTLIDKLDRQVIKHKQKRQNYSGSALKRLPETRPFKDRLFSRPGKSARLAVYSPLAAIWPLLRPVSWIRTVPDCGAPANGTVTKSAGKP